MTFQGGSDSDVPSGTSEDSLLVDSIIVEAASETSMQGFEGGRTGSFVGEAASAATDAGVDVVASSHVHAYSVAAGPSPPESVPIQAIATSLEPAAAAEAAPDVAPGRRTPDPNKKRAASINVSVSTVKRYNILVVGPSGSGKSTFCMHLLRPYFPKFKLQPPKGPTVRIEERGRCEQELSDLVRVIVTVIDTPGWGDSLNNEDRFKPIEEYVVRQNEMYERKELYRSPNRQENDSRIHCCFYFLAPHRVSPLDGEFMRRLQSRVAIVPIVAKADTMTIFELATHLKEIHSCLAENAIETFDFGETDISMRWLDEPSHDHESFARVGSSLAESVSGSPPGSDPSAQQERGALSRLPRIRNVFAVISGERHYMWGTASEEDPRHSDTQRLHKVLFQDGSLGRLQEHADGIHEAWRRRKQDRIGTAWPSSRFGVSWAALVTAAFVCLISLVVALSWGDFLSLWGISRLLGR